MSRILRGAGGFGCGPGQKEDTMNRFGTFKSPLTVFSALLVLFTSNPAAHSETAIYGWQDENGAISYTDDPTNAPSDAAMKVFSQTSETQAVTEPEQAQAGPPGRYIV